MEIMKEITGSRHDWVVANPFRVAVAGPRAQIETSTGVGVWACQMSRKEAEAFHVVLGEALGIEQHQGEPVAWRVEIDGMTLYRPLPTLTPRARNVPLYTHADPAEVEQFPHGSPANKAVFMALESYTGTTTFEQACIQLAEESKTLRAQLAEQAALLSKAAKLAMFTLPKSWHDQYEALSASAMPSAPKCMACGDTGVIDDKQKDELPSGHFVERGLVACKQCEEPSAPVSCTWTFTDNTFAWGTSCSNSFTLMEDGPRENGMKFCPYCSKPINQASTSEEQSEGGAV